MRRRVALGGVGVDLGVGGRLHRADAQLLGGAAQAVIERMLKGIEAI